MYNADNIARVQADEAAAALQRAAEDQKLQELDAARRAAILRGCTPPPLLQEGATAPPAPPAPNNASACGSRDRKRRKLAGEDETDMDIRLALASTAPQHAGSHDSRLLRLRTSVHDAPLTDHAGHINLFPVTGRSPTGGDSNADAERKKQRDKQRDKKQKKQQGKEQALALDDQQTVRFSLVTGKGAPSEPWYTTTQAPASDPRLGDELSTHVGWESRDVWGNEDPRRRDREKARLLNNDPFAFMQKAQAQLQRSKHDKKRWADERQRELKELQAMQKGEDIVKRRQRMKRGGESRGSDGTPGSRNPYTDSESRRDRSGDSFSRNRDKLRRPSTRSRTEEEQEHRGSRGKRNESRRL